MISKDECLKDRKILFLDFDGVLHPSCVFRNNDGVIYLSDPEHTLFEYADILAENLSRFSNIEVVLSTSWVSAIGFDETLEKLPKAIQEKVIGSTYPCPDDLTRFEQIMRFCIRHEVMEWIAVDDDNFMWPEKLNHHLVLTDSDEGLGNAKAQLDLVEKMRLLSR